MNARIVFDLDGTLIDSARDIQLVANTVLNRRSIEPLSLEETRSFIGEGVSRLVEYIRNARSIHEQEQATMLSEFMEMYPTAVSQTTVFDGVVDVLELLRSQKHYLGICTNKPYTPTIAVLKHLQLEHFFDFIAGGDTYSTKKPHPQSLMNTMAELPSGPQLYVGDSITDAKAAQSASIPFILYMQGYTNSGDTALQSAAQFENFSDLPAIIDRLIKA